MSHIGGTAGSLRVLPAIGTAVLCVEMFLWAEPSSSAIKATTFRNLVLLTSSGESRMKAYLLDP